MVTECIPSMAAGCDRFTSYEYLLIPVVNIRNVMNLMSASTSKQ